MSAFTHYRDFLSGVYSWSLGDKTALFERNRQWLVEKKITGNVLDLGAGFGSHAIPAFELGLDVTAVDFSPELLAELIEENADVHAVESDIVSYLRECDTFDNIFCLGDTLTHLPDAPEFLKLLNLKGRRIFLSWRDYKTLPFTAENSMVTVREEGGRKMTCELKVIDDRRILVTDSLNGKNHSYEKLRISPRDVEACFPGRNVQYSVQGRMVQMEIS